MALGRARAGPYHLSLLKDKLFHWQYIHPYRFLMRVLDSYGDDYRASQFTIVLEVSAGLWVGWENQEPRTQPSDTFPHQDEGSQGTDAPTPGNAENEPPDKEGLSPPRRTPAPPEPSSPAPGEGPSGRKRRRAPRDGCRSGAALTPELAPMQVGRAWGWGHRVVEFLLLVSVL